MEGRGTRAALRVFTALVVAFLWIPIVLIVLYAHNGLTGLFGRGGPVRRLWTRRPTEETA